VTFPVLTPLTGQWFRLPQANSRMSTELWSNFSLLRLRGPRFRELLVRFLHTETRLSLAASSGCRLSQVVCMSNFEPRRRGLRFLVSIQAVTFFLVSFQSRRLCRCSLTSKVGFACQCLPLTTLNSFYIFQRYGLGNLHQLTIHLLLYSLLLSHIFRVSYFRAHSAFQHALLTFFTGFEPVVNYFRRLRCPP
jgi:hypothetical protein